MVGEGRAVVFRDGVAIEGNVDPLQRVRVLPFRGSGWARYPPGRRHNVDSVDAARTLSKLGVDSDLPLSTLPTRGAEHDRRYEF